MKINPDMELIRVASPVSRTLRKLPRGEAFYFFTSIGNYTGDSAASLEEFAKKIGEVNTKSLEFHLYRKDFEKWVTEILGDEELAEQIERARNLSLTGEALRGELYGVFSKRYEELEKSFQPKSSFSTKGE